VTGNELAARKLLATFSNFAGIDKTAPPQRHFGAALNTAVNPTPKPKLERN
jgi:hypothetical protein